MAAQSMRLFDRRKFMWDGEAFESRATAEARKHDYEMQGFETELVEEEGIPLLYTRRVVKEIVIEGAPPAA